MKSGGVNDPMLTDKVKKTIKKHNLVNKGDKVLVAVSGGIDSVTLLHILYQLRRQLEISLFVAHLDHQFRGEESKKDAKLVKTIAKDLDLPIISESIDVQAYIKKIGLSEEEGAREVRYDFLQSRATELQADKIALGHNLNDQVETYLMRLVRGTGLKGLRGMRPKRDIYIRPLIECRREEIRQFAQEKGLKYREDRTNVSVKYLRNKIRWELIPLLEEEYNPNILKVIARTEDVVGEIISCLDKQGEKYLTQALMEEKPGEIILDKGKVLGQEIALRRIIIRKAIKRVKGSLKDIEFVHIQDILSEMEKEKPRSELHLPGRLRFEKNRNKIKLTTRKKAPNSPKQYLFKLKLNSSNSFPQIGWEFTSDKKALSEIKNLEDIYKNPLQVIVDLDKIEEPLTVRNRSEGDKFRPLGMEGSKKIKDLLIDEKIDYHRRDMIPLICSQRGIIWVVGIRLSEDYKITAATQSGLVITASPI